MTDKLKNAGQTARDEHRYQSNAKRTHIVDPFGGLVSDGNFAVQVAEDSGDANVTYVGKAQIGSATDAEVWQIMKVDGTSGTVVTWAGGSDSFSSAWDDRESLSYS